MKLIDYLPEFMANISEFETLVSGEQPFFDTLDSDIDSVTRELFAESAGEYGIARLEKIMGITPESNDLELRRFELLARMKGLEKEDIKSKISDMVGENNYSLSFDADNIYMEVKITVKSKQYLGAVKRMLELTLPCNIKLSVSLMYASHLMISDKTHEFLSNYKHEDIKLIGIDEQ